MSLADIPARQLNQLELERVAAYITLSGTPQILEVNGTAYALDAALLEKGARFLPKAKGFIDAETGQPYIVGDPAARRILEQHLRSTS